MIPLNAFYRSGDFLPLARKTLTKNGKLAAAQTALVFKGHSSSRRKDTFCDLNRI